MLVRRINAGLDTGIAPNSLIYYYYYYYILADIDPRKRREFLVDVNANNIYLERRRRKKQRIDNIFVIVECWSEELRFRSEHRERTDIID